MRGPRLAVLGGAAVLLVALAVSRPSTGAAGLVPTLPPVPSLPSLPTTPPLPTLPPVPTVTPLPTVPALPTITPVPTLPLPSLALPTPPQLTPPPLPSLSSAVPPTRPADAGDDAAEPPEPGSTAGGRGAGPAPESSEPPSGGATVSGPAPSPTRAAATLDPGSGPFDGVVLPVLAIAVPLLLALAILVVQLLGGAALLPVMRRTLGGFGLRGRAGSGRVQPEAGPRRS